MIMSDDNHIFVKKNKLTKTGGNLEKLRNIFVDRYSLWLVRSLLNWLKEKFTRN